MKYLKIIGDRGEELAAEILESRGMEILGTKFRCSVGEIDIIARKEGVYHFVEVKTRTDHRHGIPAESVTMEKQRRIRRAAEYYLKQHQLRNVIIQFDVIEVDVRIVWHCF